MAASQPQRALITHIERRYDDFFVAVSTPEGDSPGYFWVRRAQLADFLEPEDVESALTLASASDPAQFIQLSAPIEVLMTGELRYTSGSAWFTVSSIVRVTSGSN